MAKSRYVLAIDQGTTGTHISIVDEKVKVVGKAYQEFKQHFPAPGWVEHDLNEIWRTVDACIADGGDVLALELGGLERRGDARVEGPRPFVEVVLDRTWRWRAQLELPVV